MHDHGRDPGEPDWGRIERLEWTQPRRATQRWELRADGELVATLRRPHWWSRNLVAEGALGSWNLAVSWWGRHTIGPSGGAIAAESARRGFRAMTLRREAGEPLVYRTQGWLARRHVIENREGFPLIRIRERWGFLRLGGEVVLDDAGRSLPDLAALLFLGWALAIAEMRARHR